jgi:hypothetical protein
MLYNIFSPQNPPKIQQFISHFPRFSTKMHFFVFFLPKNLVMSKKSSTFAPAFEKKQCS